MSIPFNRNYPQGIRILLHTVFWLFAGVFFLFYYKRYEEINTYTLFAASINLLIAILTAYTFNYYLIPRFLLEGKYVQFILFSLLALLMFVYLQLLMTIGLLIKLLFTENRLFPGMIDVLMLFLNIFFIVIVAIAIKFYKRWSEKEHRSQLIEKEKVEAELQMLKTQINPHFLFNTLNSIYALALKKSTQTAEIVLKLSDLLDYILYKINAPQVPIGEEIAMIKNYIALEKIRYGQRVEVDFTTHIISSSTQIPPMLVIPFVENAFKHGVAKTMEQSWIKIGIRESAKGIEITVDNSKKLETEQQQKKGIGLENTLRRLKIIYGENYTFEKIEGQHKFHVKILLPKGN